MCSNHINISQYIIYYLTFYKIILFDYIAGYCEMLNVNVIKSDSQLRIKRITIVYHRGPLRSNDDVQRKCFQVEFMN